MIAEPSPTTLRSRFETESPTLFSVDFLRSKRDLAFWGKMVLPLDGEGRFGGGLKKVAYAIIPS